LSRNAPRVVRGRQIVGAVALACCGFLACGRRVPTLVPPAAGVEAVEGYGTASIRGAEAAAKGKFAFVFRRPGLGRVEGLDPFGRAAFVVVFNGERAAFVLHGKKVYAEERPETMMGRFLGLSLTPDDMLRLLCGAWKESEAEAGWRVERDEAGRVARGSREDLAFAVREFFPGAGVPREATLTGPEATGRLRVLRLRFNPPPRSEAFDLGFLRKYGRKTWDEIAEMLER